MNINSIQKHYDKLSARERFALLDAAIGRGDDADRAALVSSAPRKRWEVPTTYGLRKAFDFVSMFHVIMQLGYAASYYHLTGYDEGEDFPAKGVTWDDALELVMRRILESREAFRAVCKEYGVDDRRLLEGLPFVEMIDMTELIVRAVSELQPLELTDLEDAINGYRQLVEANRKEWE